jgi:STE24 endopeptidase
MSAVGFSVMKWARENGRPASSKAETSPASQSRTSAKGGSANKTADRSASSGKTYNRTKLAISLLGGVLLFAFVLVVVATGFSRAIAFFASSLSTSRHIALLIFAAILGIMEMAVSFPLKVYSGFYLEHKYNLSNQSLLRWLWEHAKAVLVGIPLAVPLLLIFFYCLEEYGAAWWFPVGVVMFVFMTLLARVAPKFIFPLFYKFVPLSRADLKDRIARLCAEAGFRIEGVFSFNMSKNTKKANAGFTGLGRTKRVILGDTLLEKFSDDEIETVLAHELGHYRFGHIWKGILINTIVTFFGLFITSRLYVASLSLFGFERIDDLAALPLLGLWLGIFGFVTTPLMNMISRKHEYEADHYAVRKSGNPSAFIGALNKLADTNLADSTPPPLVEFLFYSHPSIEKRIKRAEKELEEHAFVNA